jgi:predicted RNase H-like HicB family nuclease
VTDIIDHRVDAALRAPSTRVLQREEDGGYSCEVLEFPGCYSSGGDAQEAMAALDDAMALWVESELEAGNAIPPPLDLEEHSGRLTLRLPPSLHERAATRATAERVSLNRLLSAAIAGYLGVEHEQPRAALRIAEERTSYEPSTAPIRELAERVLTELDEREP